MPRKSSGAEPWYRNGVNVDLSAFAIDDHIGVHTPHGDQFFIVTKGGLDGPYLDRECTIAYITPELAREIRANARAELHFQTGKRRRNKEMTMSDGKSYRTDGNGAIHCLEPRLSKKDRRRLKHAGEAKPEGLPHL